MEDVVHVRGLSHRYHGTPVLDRVDLNIPRGSLFALLGTNGAGKTTLMKILVGLLAPRSGSVEVLGVQPYRMPVETRARVGYVAEGQRLPEWMTVAELEAYLAPLYPDWSADLADELVARLRIPRNRVIRRLSRGEAMKAALMITLAPRPELLILDEPFTGMDALVKDELVEGLLEVVAEGDWTVVMASHDIGELEGLADRVAILQAGEVILSEPMDVLKGRFRRVDVIVDVGVVLRLSELPPDWLSVGRSGSRTSFLVTDHGSGNWDDEIRARFPGARRIDIRGATLREVFVGLARDGMGES